MLALLMIAAMSFTACGGGDDDGGSPTTYDKTGKCVDNVIYKYSEATGLLIIQGNGAMAECHRDR